MNTLLICTLLGVGLGLGAWLVVDALRRSRTELLAARVAPQLSAPGAALSRPARRAGPSDALSRLADRLAAAGRTPDAAHHRSVTLVWAVVAGAGMVALFALLATRGPVRPVPALLAVIAAVVAVFWGRDSSLRRAARRRTELKQAQFPLLAELLALSVAAGDALGPALARASQQLPAPLGDDVRTALARIDAGVPVSRAFEDLAADAGVPALRDAVDSVLVAGERGTPLAAVLRDQATDAREAARRDLMEEAGKIEIKMMLPVVFGLLPLSVLFAIFPSLALLTFNV